MKDEGPALEALLHCLAQCPADLVEHCGQSTSLTTALVCDYFRRHEPQLDVAALVAQLRQSRKRAQVSLMAILIWVLSHLVYATSRSCAQHAKVIRGSPSVEALRTGHTSSW